MTTTRVYKSTDSGAPVLVGGVSALLNLLDKCLVSGYGSKTPLGWTKPFTGADKAAFRNSVAAGGSGMYLRVDDSGSGTGGEREALCRAYLTMSDVDTGTVETPTMAQLAASSVWRKSATIDSTPRAWSLVGDELTFYLNIDTGTVGGSGTSSVLSMAAGDIASDVPGDTYRFFVAGKTSQQGAGNQGSGDSFLAAAPFNWWAGAEPTNGGAYLARGYAGTGDPLKFGLLMLGEAPSGGVLGATTGSHLDRPSLGGSLSYYYPAVIASESTIRGRLRGMYLSMNTGAGLTWQSEIVDPPGLIGSLMVLKHNTNASFGGATVEGHIYVDITNAWEAP